MGGGGRRGGECEGVRRSTLGWHEQLLTENQDLLVAIETLLLLTMVYRRVYSLL